MPTSAIVGQTASRDLRRSPAAFVAYERPRLPLRRLLEVGHELLEHRLVEPELRARSSSRCASVRLRPRNSVADRVRLDDPEQEEVEDDDEEQASPASRATLPLTKRALTRARQSRSSAVAPARDHDPPPHDATTPTATATIAMSRAAAAAARGAAARRRRSPRPASGCAYVGDVFVKMHRPGLRRLPHPAREPVGAVGLQVGSVVRATTYGADVVEARAASGARSSTRLAVVELDVLLLVERVVLRVAPVRVVVVVRRVLRRRRRPGRT